MPPPLIETEPVPVTGVVTYKMPPVVSRVPSLVTSAPAGYPPVQIERATLCIDHAAGFVGDALGNRGGARRIANDISEVVDIAVIGTETAGDVAAIRERHGAAGVDLDNAFGFRGTARVTRPERDFAVDVELTVDLERSVEVKRCWSPSRRRAAADVDRRIDCAGGIPGQRVGDRQRAGPGKHAAVAAEPGVGERQGRNTDVGRNVERPVRQIQRAGDVTSRSGNRQCAAGDVESSRRRSAECDHRLNGR